MELSEVTADHNRPASTGSGHTATDSHGGDAELSLVDEHIISTELGGSSDDGRVQPLLKHPPKERVRWRVRVRHVLGFLLANWYKFVVLGIIITMIVLVSIYGFSIFGVILQWFKKRNGWGGWGVFIGFYTAIVTLFFPGVIFIMGAGFIFGFWRGLLAVWIGGAIGQALSFLLARYLLRDWVENFVRKKWEKWKYIDAAIEKEGWKLVLIMRLSPIIPYNLLNIAMATTSMHFGSFVIASAIGVVFECAVFTYIGTMAESITSIASGEAGPPKAIEWVLLGLSLAMCILGAVVVSIMVKRAIRKAEEAGMSELEVNRENERDALIAGGPSSLSREDPMRESELHAADYETGESQVRKVQLGISASPERSNTPNGIIANLINGRKAKRSPKSRIADANPSVGSKGDGQKVINGDLEMGSGPAQGMSSNRRGSANRTDSDDELQKH